MGVAQFLKADMVKPGATVLDVGVNRIADPSAPRGSRLVGDVDFGSSADCRPDYPQSWRCGPDDHCHADAEYRDRSRTSDRLLKVLSSSSIGFIACYCSCDHRESRSFFYGSI